MFNQKGFNLFTAMIALMLVSITIVFIYNMVQTEENYLALIEDQSNNSDLLTIADLSRADAFNIFVVSFREKWAAHRSDPSNHIVVSRNNLMLSWDDFIEYFANDIFFDSQFESFFAQNLVQSLQYSNPPIGYSLNIPEYDRTELSRIIKESFNLAGDKKIEVVRCEREDNICLGSLYFTIDTRTLSSQDYEKLPMVVVEKLRDNEVVQRPVFARREYRIYLPWRGFQALRTARNFSLTADVEKEPETTTIIRRSLDSRGFFNPNIHYTLNSAKIGVCDIDSCAPREDLFKTANKDGFQNECNLLPVVSSFSANNGSGINVSRAGTIVNLSSSFSYNLSDFDSRDTYKNLVETTLRSNLQGRNDIINSGGAGNNSLTTNGTIGQDDFKINNVSITSSNKITKNVVNTIATGKNVGSISSVSFDPNSFNKASNLGLKIDNENKTSVISDITSGISPDPLNSNLVCHTLSQLDIELKFTEENPKYIVSEDSVDIHIKLRDNFTSFSFYDNSYVNSFNNNFKPYFLDSTTITSPLLNNNNWSCISYEGQTAGPAACIAGNGN